jgi:hypothetical protein
MTHIVGQRSRLIYKLHAWTCGEVTRNIEWPNNFKIQSVFKAIMVEQTDQVRPHKS